MVVISRPSPYGAGHQVPDTIIVHSMAYQLDLDGERLYAATFLEQIKLSAHALVTPDAQIIRCREDNQGAYHAKGFNTNSLGVEVLVPGVYDYASWKKRIDEPGWCSPDQFEATIKLVRRWVADYGITKIYRHSDVDPSRKYDPGKGFDWDLFLKRVKA